MSSELFSIQNIHFRYEDESVFDDFSVEIKQGEKVAIKGESGSGKTTLFRILLGFEHPEKGNIMYQGVPYSTENIHKIRKEVAWLPQDLNLGSGITSELVDFIFEFQHNIESKPSRSKLVETLNQLGLGKDTLDSKFNDLSTGQRQRVGLATCYLLNKKVLLLDEPTSALDEQSKQKVADLILQDNITVISTSHDPWWVERCNRIIELENYG
jgi:ABC-type bacteriocin/lantibiotic exporter with double-glycine peptidase domain